jgi:hypothetical protein
MKSRDKAKFLGDVQALRRNTVLPDTTNGRTGDWSFMEGLKARLLFKEWEAQSLDSLFSCRCSFLATWPSSNPRGLLLFLARFGSLGWL